jgi:S-adenosyl-L-methionine hydrolase (adenosine-forming)
MRAAPRPCRAGPLSLRTVLIAFASDYGLTDEFVGVCKAVMVGLAPDVQILDLSHEIPAHDVRAGALLLVRAVQYLPDETIVLAVVDPGVGTARRLVAVEVGGGVFLGPDNGILAPAVAMAGGALRVVSLDNPDYQLPAPGPTFAGRDVLAAAAGHLAAGVPLSELGDDLDPATLVPGLVSLPEIRADGGIAGEVWWVDRFGNCQLNIDPSELGPDGALVGTRFEVQLTSGVRAARVVHTYSDAKPSELVLLVDSYGLLSLALDRGSAAAALGLRAGSAVTLLPEGRGDERPESASPGSSVDTPVEIGRRPPT